MKQPNVIFVFLAVLGISLFFISCTPEKKGEPHEADEHVLLIESQVKDIAAIRPDSAEILLKNGVLYCDSMNHEEGLLKMHSLLAEFYQYWIISDGLAYFHMNEAINIYMRNPQYRIDDPYFYANLGNIQLKFGHTEHALQSYRNALLTSEKVGNIHGQILSNNNIGLVWQYSGNYDSADYYFSKSLNIIGDDVNLNKTQLYFYQMRLKALQETPDSLPWLFNLLKESMREYNNFKGGEENLDNTEKRYFGQVFGSACLLMGEISSGEVRLSFLNDAVRSAVPSRDPLTIYASYLALGNELLETGYISESGLIADTLMNISQFIYNPEPLIQIFEFCNKAAVNSGDHEKALRAGVLAKQMQDSLQKQNSGQEHLKARMQISAVNASIAVENMKLAKSAGEKIIRQQKFIIVLLVSAIGLIMIVVSSIWLYRSRLKFANRMLALKTARIASSDCPVVVLPSVKEGTSSHGFDGFASRLDQLNREKQPYLNPSLTLSDLASMLGTNQSYMSAFLNQKLGLNFNDYLNSLRIQYASKLLLNPEKKYSMEQVFEMSGFNSKSTFYTAFKKHAGISPAAFVKLNRVNEHT